MRQNPQNETTQPTEEPMRSRPTEQTSTSDYVDRGVIREARRKWLKVFKNGVLLALCPTLLEAQRMAEYVGGEIGEPG